MKQVVPAGFRSIIVALGLAGGGFQAVAQHVHLAVGVDEPRQGVPIRLINGSSYDIFSYGGIFPACFFMSQDNPLYPGLFQSDVTLTALPATLWVGGPNTNAAAQGAYIQCIIKSVEGPGGALFGYWQEDEEQGTTEQLLSIPTGSFGLTNRFNVSEGVVDMGVDTPDGWDPFGHIHGRRFTANKPGLYTLGFQFIDTCHAGTNGGPIHPPSGTNFFYFQAGLYIDFIVKTNQTVTARFGSRAFNHYEFQASTNLASTNWVVIQTIPPSNPSHSDMHYLYDTNAVGPARFYRLKEIPD